MTTNEKIITLVKPEYLKKIPAIFRKHASFFCTHIKFLSSLGSY